MHVITPMEPYSAKLSCLVLFFFYLISQPRHDIENYYHELQPRYNLKRKICPNLPLKNNDDTMLLNVRLDH